MSKDEHKERQRVTKACDNCRKKKIKCDAKPDVCSSCELLQIPCLYLDPTKKRGPPKGAGRHVNTAEDRLNTTMEGILSGSAKDEHDDGMDSPKGSSSSSSSKPRRRKSTKSNVRPSLGQMPDQDFQQQSPDLQQIQTPFPSVKSDHPSPSLADYSFDQAFQQQQQQQQQFQVENLFQTHHHQQQFLQQQQQQQLSLHQHSSHFLESQQDPSQSPDRLSQAYSEDMQRGIDPHLINPVHQDLIRESVLPSFNSPSPVLGSEHSLSDRNERSPGADSLPQLGMHTPPMPDLDELEEDMGHLTLDHKGIERYVGKSSPMFYNQRHWGGYSIRERDLPEARKFVENPDLPSPEIMTKLLNLYFTFVHPFAPVIVWSKFLKRLQTKDYSPSFLFLLNSLFAVSSRFSDDVSLRTDPARPETLGVHFVEKAKAILDTIYDSPDIHCVGGLILLSYQQMGTGGGYRAWMFIGLAIRMAQHLGLNRDCVKLNPNMPLLDKEERNRIWWTCFVADRIISATFGRPQGINEHDVDATYPEGIDEENIQLEYRIDSTAPMLTGPSPRSERNFVYMASLTRIMGRVMLSLYSPMSKATSKSSSSMTNPAPLEQLDKELTEWLLQLPPHLQFRSVQQEPGTFVCTLHMTFYATLILLHRPYSHQSPHNTHDWSISLSICTSAANNTIEMASNLMRTSDDNKDVPRLKRLLHSAVFILFTAGLIHITNCTSMDPVLAASAKLRTVETLRCLSVIEDVWITGKWCGNNIKNLLKSRNIELPCSVEGFKYHLRHGVDPSSMLNGINPAQLELLPTAVKMISKEQSFAFDVDQIMGYYQASPGVRHAEPMGRNSRHFSPTPYFSPVSPHHAQNQPRAHPGLTQGHSPLPRRPRQTKNTSPTPGAALVTPPSGVNVQLPANSTAAGAPIYPTPSAENLMMEDPGLYTTQLLDPFAVPGATAVVNSLQQRTPIDPVVVAATAPSVGANGGSLNMFQNPFSSTVWSLPTSLDNDEWILYMQSGASGGGHSSNDSSVQHTLGLTNGNNNNNGNTNSSSSSSSNGRGSSTSPTLSQSGGNNNINIMPGNSATLLDNSSVNLGMSTIGVSSSSSSSGDNKNSGNSNNNNAAMSNRMHPLAQSMTRSDLFENTVVTVDTTVAIQQRSSPGPQSSGLIGGGGGNFASSPSTQQQILFHQQQQQQRQPILPSQNAADFTFLMNGANIVPPLQQQTAVSGHPWNT